MKINDVNTAIMFGNYTYDQLNSIAMALKFARNEMGKVKRFAFDVGQRVRFTGKGQTFTGTVTAIMIKKAKVRIDNTNEVYIVPLVMIQSEQ